MYKAQFVASTKIQMSTTDNQYKQGGPLYRINMSFIINAALLHRSTQSTGGHHTANRLFICSFDVHTIRPLIYNI